MSLASTARDLGVEAELGMVLDLTAELAGRDSFQTWARGLRPVAGEPRYLTAGPSVRVSALGRAVADERTPAVVARWGFRENMPDEGFRRFFEKHRG